VKNDLQEQDALWDLLGRSRQVRPTPFFARNVLRQIRHTPRSPRLPALVLRWLSATTLVLLIAGFSLSLTPPPATPQSALNPETIEHFDAAAGINELVLVEEFTFDTFVDL